MSCSRTPKPPSPDSFRRALGNREKAFRQDLTLKRHRVEQAGQDPLLQSKGQCQG